jgi:hypothetical protein
MKEQGSLPTPSSCLPLREGDWIVIEGTTHEVRSVRLEGSSLSVETASGKSFRMPLESVASCLYSRVEDRHSDTALGLRVQEVMLMSQIQLHQSLPSEGEDELHVRVELIHTLMEVRRRMAHRRQRPSLALPLTFEAKR